VSAAMKTIILKNLWWVAFGTAFILLIDHSFKLVNVTVDTTSILLLVVMLLSPFVTAVKKIKFGDFEAEIDIAEIRKIKSEAEKTLSDSQSDQEIRPEIYEISSSIKTLAESDPVIALAKIRIELEKALGQLARYNSLETKGHALGRIINEIANQEIITGEMGKTLRQVISVCNRAIHGESISEEGLTTIIDVGIELLEEIYWIARNEAATGTIVDEETITQQMMDEYSLKRFRLTSITPYVENPKKTVRELTLEQLEEVLEDYNEYAEFIVELVEIANSKK
jgi:hypothetical protein